MQNLLASIYILQICFDTEFAFDIYTLDRWQLKTLLTIDERVKKIARISAGEKWQSKTLIISIFDRSSSIVLTFSIAVYPM